MTGKADALDQRAAAQLDVEIIPGTEVMVSTRALQTYEP
jgi:hypothetical protein